MTETNDIAKNMHDFIQYLETNGISTKNGDSYFYKNYYICHIQKWDDGKWVMFWGDNNQQKDLENVVTDESIKQFMRDNVKICGGDCGCKTWPRGGSPTIFGQTFESVCSSFFIFMNPDNETFINLKKLIIFMKIIADKYEERKIKWRANQAGIAKISNSEIDSLFPREKAVNIELNNMEIKNWVKAAFTNNTMILTNTGSNRGRAHTQQKFSVPIKIALRIKINHAHLEILFNKGSLKFHQEENYNELRIYDISNGEGQVYANKAHLPVDEFVDIEWICAKAFMAVRVNGEVRHFSVVDDYIYAWINDSDFNVSSPVSVCCYRDSTVTVASLHITEL